MPPRKPPASRARLPRRTVTRRTGYQPGRHSRTYAQPEITGRQAAAAGGRGAQRGYQAGRAGTRVARQGIARGGQHALMAEFILFCGIVGLRAVADYVPRNEGGDKGEIQPRAGQLGPLPILAAGFIVYFVLSFLAARGGTWAKAAAAFGLLIDLVLLMKSLPELGTVSQGFTNISQPQAASTGGTAEVLPTPSGTLNPQTSPGVFTQLPDATGLFPVITSNVPPAAQQAGQNPNVFTQP
jgi:hypothetical protein